MSSEEKERKRIDKKIAKHMKENGIGQSDGLVVNKDGDVVYDSSADGRSNGSRPSGTSSSGLYQEPGQESDDPTICW